MYIQMALMLAAVNLPTPAAAQGKSVSVAEAFLKAFLAGDAVAIRNLRTDDAALVGGDVAIPMSGLEGALPQSPFLRMKCSSGRLALSPEPVAANLLDLASVKGGDARWIEGTISCASATGQTRNTPVKIVVVREKVAVFAF